MGWAAVEKLEPAFNETKELLLPFDLGTWLRLAVIVVLTGAGLSLPNAPLGGSSDGGMDFEDTAGQTDSDIHSVFGAETPHEAVSAVTASEASFIALAGIVVLIGVLGLFLVSSVMELVFYRVLEDRNVRIRNNFRRHFSSGLSYFMFRIAVFAGLLVVFGAVVGIFRVSAPAGFLSILAALPLLLIAWVIGFLVHSFIVPAMMENETKFVEELMANYKGLKSEWKEVGVFFFMKIVVGIGASIINGVWVLASLIAVAVLFGIPALLINMVFTPLAAILAVVAAVFWLFLLLAAQVPIQTFIYSYTLLVYQEVL